MGAQQRERLYAGCSRARKSEQSAVKDTVDVKHNERSAPAQIASWLAKRAAMTRCLHGQEVPGVHEAPMVVALGIAAARVRAEELLLGSDSSPKGRRAACA